MSVNRYQSTSKTKDDRYNTARYPSFPKQPTDLYIISRELDRLDLLSNEFYEDPRFWWVLAQVNNLGKGTLDIRPGIQLRIPFPLTDLTVMLRDIEATK